MPVPPLCRFHKLIWGSFGSGLLEASGVIAGGGDNGMLTLYNVTHILSSGKEPVIDTLLMNLMSFCNSVQFTANHFSWEALSSSQVLCNSKIYYF